jgi:hypothetical protein
MPALTRLRVTALEDLAAGQRFTPGRTIARQIDRIERLALEIDREGMYAEDWIAHRITGFRPRIEEPRQIVGAALLADLSALAERLSDDAALGADSAPGAIGIDGLASLWGVSRKTIDRYRRDGLIGRRARGPGGTVRIVFTPSAVEGFARVRGPRIDRAGAFSRLTDAERSRAIRWARVYRSRLGWTVSQASARIAVRLHRSAGAVRAALAASGAPDLVVRPMATGRDARLAERALVWGVPVARIAARVGRSRATVHRMVLDARAARVRTVDLATPLDDRFTRATADRALGESGAAPHAPRWTGVDEALAAARAWAPVDADTERAWALAYHALRWTVARERDAHAPVHAGDIDRWETLLRWASVVKRGLIASEIGLIVRTAEGVSGVPIGLLGPARAARVVRGGLAIVGAVVDGFDPSRGGRIAAAATLPVSRWMTSEAAVPSATRARPRASSGLEGWDRAITPWDAWTREPMYVARWWTALEESPRSALAARFGLATERPHTVAELAARLGCTPRRAGAIVADAIVACRGLSAGAPG